ncbi:MAG: hypothetical protein FWE67_14140 [Planctomycetaceae bacterium]|nr:hypothetical protein [Planctomycetaceae bacterium]
MIQFTEVFCFQGVASKNFFDLGLDVRWFWGEGLDTVDTTHLFYSVEPLSGKPAVGNSENTPVMPPDLQAVIQCWSTLPKTVRKTIVTLAKASRKKQRSQ